MTMQKSFSIIHQRGVSLIELMVSITIGLLLMASVASLYVSNVRAFGNQDDDSRLQETARAAFDTIGYHIRLAGFVDAGADMGNTNIISNPAYSSFFAMTDARNNDMLSLFFGAGTSAGTTYSNLTGTVSIHAVAGCEGLFSTNFTTYPWTCSSTTGPSSITLSYQVQPALITAVNQVRAPIAGQDSLPAYNSSTGAGGDCGGNDVGSASASPSGPLAINRFYVDTSTNRLMCLGNGKPNSAKAIADGVEDMRILYGILPATLSTTTPNDAFVGRYVTAPNVTNWVNVISIQVCMQFASITSNKSLNVTSYVDCSGTSHTTTDGKVRQVTRQTFALQNNIFTIPDSL